MGNPVRRGQALRPPKPLPRCLKEEEVTTLFGAIRRPRDRVLFLLMLRSGLRVEEVANLTLEALDLTRGRVHVHHGKSGKDRVVYISPDTHRALTEYLQRRPGSRPSRSFWWKRARIPAGPCPCEASRNAWNTMLARPG